MLAVQYVKWANKRYLDDFWTDPKVKRLYKNHIYAMTSRTNVYNGERPHSNYPPSAGPRQILALRIRADRAPCIASTLGCRQSWQRIPHQSIGVQQHVTQTRLQTGDGSAAACTGSKKSPFSRIVCDFASLPVHIRLP